MRDSFGHKPQPPNSSARVGTDMIEYSIEVLERMNDDSRIVTYATLRTGSHPRGGV